MIATTHTSPHNRVPEVSLLHRAFRVIRWLLALSLVATLFIGLIRYPLERSAVDPTAVHLDSDYVSVRGLPHFYFVSDRSVTHAPPTSVLLGHFVLDWLAMLIIFCVPVFGIEGIRLIAFFAARSVRARLPQ